MRHSIVATIAAIAVAGVVPAYSHFQKSDLKEISLERTPCFGACPIYKVTLKPDGKVVYEGKRFVDKIGRYEAQVNSEDVQRINEIVHKLGYWKLKDKYTAQITDMPSALVTVVTEKKSKTTDNYGNQGPTELWAIEQLIDKVVAGAQDWKKIE